MGAAFPSARAPDWLTQNILSCDANVCRNRCTWDRNCSRARRCGSLEIGVVFRGGFSSPRKDTFPPSLVGCAPDRRTSQCRVLCAAKRAKSIYAPGSGCEGLDGGNGPECRMNLLTPVPLLIEDACCPERSQWLNHLTPALTRTCPYRQEVWSVLNCVPTMRSTPEGERRWFSVKTFALAS